MTTVIDAVRALRARGIDNAEDMLEHGTPPELLAACHRWDQRKNVGPGVLVAMIRAGEFRDPTPPTRPPPPIGCAPGSPSTPPATQRTASPNRTPAYRPAAGRKTTHVPAT